VESAFPGKLWTERTPVRFIHRGGWSDTVEARSLGGDVSAVKVAEAGGELAPGVERWAEAARRVADAVSHPCVLTYRSVDVVDGWLSAERSYVEGVDAGTAISTLGSAPLEVAAAVSRRAAEAALAAHAAGLVAGRLTPSHVLVGRDGATHVLSVGLPEVSAFAHRMEGRQADREVAYAPPERFAGGVADARADAFGVASIFLWLATGHPVIPEGHRLARVLARRGATLVGEGAPAPVPDPQLAELLGRAMSVEPARRPDVTTLASALASRAAEEAEVAGFARAVVGEAALGDGRE
jgi:serine/threonine-protein kinase